MPPYKRDSRDRSPTSVSQSSKSNRFLPIPEEETKNSSNQQLRAVKQDYKFMHQKVRAGTIYSFLKS